MRVITGIARGKKLISPSGYDVRPTTDKVKEAVFSIIQNEIEGARILDLFCGTGQMGIEALSRGASRAVFVDNDIKSIKIAKENLKITKFIDSNIDVVTSSASAYLKSNKEKFDIAFLDPPYSKNILENILPDLSDKMFKTGIILCEHDRNDILDDEYGCFKKFKTYNYGRISLTSYKYNEN